MPPFLITLSLLSRLKACDEHVEKFRIAFPDGIRIEGEPDPDTTRKIGGAGLDVEWFASKILTAPARAEFDRVVAAARAEYARVVAAARAEYARVEAAARAEYARVMADARAEYARVMAPARAEYDRVQDTAQAEFDRVMTPARA